MPIRPHWLTLLSLGFFGLLLNAYGQTTQDENHGNNARTMTMPSEQAIDALNHRKFFFMHHSVGDNIIKGIEMLADELLTPVNIMTLDGEATTLAIPHNGLAHARGGKNRYPQTKIDAFASQMARFAVDSRPQIAFMKFCFVDFSPDTDPQALFQAYATALKRLEVQFPDVRFVHFTAPLTRRPDGWKDRIYRIIGREIWEDAANMQREKYNQLIRTHYPKSQVFDLAFYESNRPDGGRERQTSGDFTFYSLVPAYTYDGGHLNDTGKKRIAAMLIDFLSNL